MIVEMVLLSDNRYLGGRLHACDKYGLLQGDPPPLPRCMCLALGRCARDGTCLVGKGGVGVVRWLCVAAKACAVEPGWRGA